jgi:hypothetical protein
MLGEDFLEQVGDIIPERWADSDRNGGRLQPGMMGGFSPESANPRPDAIREISKPGPNVV